MAATQSQIDNLVSLLDGYVEKGGHHLNINVFTKETLLDKMVESGGNVYAVGKIADIFAPGTYKLATENIPFLTKMLSLPTGFNSTIKAEVYFVNTKQFTGLKWGTQNPIMLRDAEFGNVRLRGFGTYSFKVVDVRKFMEEVLGTNGLYKVADIEDHNKPLIIQGIADALGEGKISALDLAANYKEVADKILTPEELEELISGNDD